MTHSERKWLLEQMASQRKRSVGTPRPEGPGQRRARDPAPPTAEDPHTGDAPGEAHGEETAVRRKPPPAADSFWSFG